MKKETNRRVFFMAAFKSADYLVQHITADDQRVDFADLQRDRFVFRRRHAEECLRKRRH